MTLVHAAVVKSTRSVMGNELIGELVINQI